MHVRDSIFVGGTWLPSTSEAAIDVVNPATEEVIGQVPAGSAADVAAGVMAARQALPGWAALPVDERADHLDRIAKALQERQDELAELVTSEMGMPIKLSRNIQVGQPINHFANAANLVRSHPFEERIGHSRVYLEPVGVVGCITPWNFPLHQLAAKVAAALAAGCTVVAKPSEVTPLSVGAFAEIVDAAGLPGGVLNIVFGAGEPVGEALATHPGVDLLSFTGSTRAGTRVAELAARGATRVTLELGGKSPNVVLDDADLERAVADGVTKCFLNSGQVCSGLTRMLVPRDRLAEAERIATERAARWTAGDPFDPATRLGPVVSDRQRARVREYIQAGIDEGARLVCGGTVAPPGPTQGYYVAPTVFSDVTSGMTIAQEEIFGPVLVLIPYDDEDDAARIANDTIYGLAAGVWSADEERALAFARRIHAGQIDINGAPFNPLAPFGGHKMSGYGRELGRHGIQEFLVTKSIQMPVETR